MKLSACRLNTAAALILMVQLPVSLVYANEQYITSDNREITQGREVWLNNCEACHGYGIADAPVPMNPEEWDYRLAKGATVLYTHAIDGFIGPDYSMMPARGGNQELTDDEVKLAVDYMIYLANFYINKQVKQ
jgi:cytochrome c5